MIRRLAVSWVVLWIIGLCIAARRDASAAPDAGPGKAGSAALAAELAAWKTAKPVFDSYCAGCHSKSGEKTSARKLSRFDITSYPIGGRHAATIGVTVRKVLGLSGRKPTMPSGKPGAVTGDDLAKVKAWTDAWVAADAAGAHVSPPGH
jgi:mono/diheme cytochrome c family protein